MRIRFVRRRRPTKEELEAAAYALRLVGDQRHSGRITDEEYAARKQAILDRLGPY